MAAAGKGAVFGGRGKRQIDSVLMNFWRNSLKFGRFGPTSDQIWPSLPPQANFSIVILAFLLNITEVRAYLDIAAWCESKHVSGLSQSRQPRCICPAPLPRS